MNKIYKGLISFGIISVVSAGTLYSQPYILDENGNGSSVSPLLSFALPFEVAPDPTGGIANSPVLIYSLEESVVSGDLALMESDGSTVAALLRFFTPAGQTSSDVIFYSQANGTLAGTGIPYSATPTLIRETSPKTGWFPGPNQPGRSTQYALPVGDIFEYYVVTGVPEPLSRALLLVAAGVWLSSWGCRGRGFSARKCVWG
jgi:hypothetical protein